MNRLLIVQVNKWIIKLILVISAFLKIYQFQNFQDFKGDLSKKLPEPSMWLLVNNTKPKTFLLVAIVLKLMSFNSGELQNSKQLQSNTVNCAMSITINLVIR